MVEYRYRAVSGTSQREMGIITADSIEQARAMLRARGLYVVGLTRATSVLGMIGGVLRRLRSRPGAEDLAVLCRQAATMLRAGVPVLTTMTVLARQAAPGMRDSLLAVMRLLAGGESLGESLRRQGRFPAVMVSMVSAGEAGGMLDEVLERLADHFEQEGELQSKVRSALFYPAFVIGLSIVVVVFMITVVLPNYVVIFREAGASLPLPTQILLWVNAMLTSYWLIGVVVCGVLVVVGRLLMRMQEVRVCVDGWLLGIPLFGGLWLRLELARITRTTGALLSGGVAIDEALRVVEGTASNRVLAGVVMRCRRAVRQGDLLSVPLQAAPMIPAMVVEMVTVGEQSGTLAEMLIQVAEAYEREADRLVGRLAAVLGPCLIVGLGLVVAFILVAIIMPMFDVFELID